MKGRIVAFKPAAQDDLASLYIYIARASSPEVAERYVESIVRFSLALSNFSFRGTARDDLSPGLRTISYRARALIVFSVEPSRVVVHGVFYGGQNWEDRFLD